MKPRPERAAACPWASLSVIIVGQKGNKMDNPPSSEQKDQTAEPPAPEVLQPRSEESTAPEAEAATKPPDSPKPPKRRHNAYRPSHKATFIGLTVVVLVLALNAIVITVVLKHSKGLNSEQGQVTISKGALSELGVNRSAIGDSGIELIVGPDARFNGKVKVGGDLSVSGQLLLNSQFSAPSANIAKLQAGDTTLSQLNVNGDSTLSKLSLRNDLVVAGTTRLQGAVTITSLLTVNNSLNVAGNLGVGGTLAVGRISTSNLNVGGHIVTSGATPGVGRGSCVGSNGTVSISGNDQAGTVAVNIGAGACAGSLASISFRSAYGSTPHVVITPIGRGMDGFYVNRSTGGFSIGASSAPGPGGYAFDYIVEQ